jgi:hypothetical protein
MKNQSNPRDVDPLLLQEVVRILSAHFALEVEIKSVIFLSKPERRNLVLRIILQSPLNGMPTSVIFKQSHLEKDCTDDKEMLGRFARDWAGLEFISKLNIEPPIAPRFYGGSEKHLFVLLEDLGDVHFSLVDSLTAKDRNAAIAALTRYMKCMGQFHANSYGRTEQYNELLQKLNPGAEIWQDELKTSLDETLSKVASLLEKLAIPYTQDLQQEINNVFKIAKEPGHFTTYIHGDICPDNVFDNPEKDVMHFIDFEWGMVRNALLDGTYLRMSMPTCWCTKAFPEDIIEKFETIYRQELAKNIPATSDDDLYYEAYVCACAYWALSLLAYGVDRVLDKELDISDPIGQDLHPNWKPKYNVARPRYLHRLQTFINVSSRHGKFPHLKIMAEQVLKELKNRWPEAKPLELFPAFM